MVLEECTNLTAVFTWDTSITEELREKEALSSKMDLTTKETSITTTPNPFKESINQINSYIMEDSKTTPLMEKLQKKEEIINLLEGTLKEQEAKESSPGKITKDNTSTKDLSTQKINSMAQVFKHLLR